MEKGKAPYRAEVIRKSNKTVNPIPSLLTCKLVCGLIICFTGLRLTMRRRTLQKVFGHAVFSFTRGVTEHSVNPEEPEFTAESFGYDPLQSTGQEWNYLPVDEFIYQEYSDTQATSLDYLASSRL